MPCYRDQNESCASDKDLREFLRNHYFYKFHVDNFINMERVVTAEESLERNLDISLIKEVNLDSPEYYEFKLIEHRNTLSDSRISSLGLYEQK